jgi:hypothetical protein
LGALGVLEFVVGQPDALRRAGGAAGEHQDGGARERLVVRAGAGPVEVGHGVDLHRRRRFGADGRLRERRGW